MIKLPNGMLFPDSYVYMPVMWIDTFMTGTIGVYFTLRVPTESEDGIVRRWNANSSIIEYRIELNAPAALTAAVIVDEKLLALFPPIPEVIEGYRIERFRLGSSGLMLLSQTPQTPLKVWIPPERKEDFCTKALAAVKRMRELQITH